jgi:hypothetical protein
MTKLRSDPEQQAYERRMALLYEQLKKGEPFESEGASTQNPTCKALIGLIRHSSSGGCGAVNAHVPQLISWFREEHDGS